MPNYAEKFSAYSTADLIGQLRLEAREKLDPEFEAFLSAVADRLKTAEADANRYGWLRNRDLETVFSGGVFVGVTPDNLVINGDDLDHAVDAAMAAECAAVAVA